ncbi:hypothetical protein [Actinomadura bangladeshensis]|uniref:Uncharacterized protein n=1 Tax=Actinomadura bangladeshensis TaxID=453573 RepID=A0A6L9QC00_9ACTN|nr:hypothetical protein [Actinomadura bangladeshensis]NEA22622.1 hypothetical protein [Actinomadura bangladeshensis]
MTRLLRPFAAAAFTAAVLTAISGRLHVGVGAGLAVLAVWWLLSWTVGDSLDWSERRPDGRNTRR